MSAFEIAFEQLYSSIPTAKLQANLSTNLSVNLLAGRLALGALSSRVGNKINDWLRRQIRHSSSCRNRWRQEIDGGFCSRAGWKKQSAFRLSKLGTGSKRQQS